MPPAARLTDMHICPMQTPAIVPIPHVGGPIVGPGVPNVLIGMMPASVVGDMLVCVGPPDVIVQGSMAVMISGRPAARMGDMTAHGGVIAIGCPNVMIGDMGGGGGGGGGGAGGGGDPDSSSDEDDADNAGAVTQTAMAATDSGGGGGGGAGGPSPATNSSSGKSSDKPYKPDPNKTHFVEVQLVDETGKAVANEPYRITLPDGSVAAGNLDGDGLVKLPGIDAGQCKVEFPKLHMKLAYDAGSGN